METVSRAEPRAHHDVPPGTARVSAGVDASPARAFDALARREHVAPWFGELGASLAPGTATRLDFGDGDFFTIEHVLAEPPSLLSYRRRFLGRGPASEVTWEIAPSSPGRSTVTVSDDDPLRDAHGVAELIERWTDLLQRLQRHLATGAVTRCGWRRSFEGAFMLRLSPAEAQARLLGGAERTWLPFARAVIADNARVRIDGTPERFTVGGVVRAPAQLDFDLSNARWRSPTHCSVRITPRATGALLSVAHTGWDEIGDDVSALGERQRFAELWLEALDRAKALASRARAAPGSTVAWTS